MSGAEAFAVVGLIGSIISIVDGAKKVRDAASNTKGFPQAFRFAERKLPLVRDILSSVGQSLNDGDIDEGSYQDAKDVIEECKKKAQMLEEIFKKVMPADSSTWMKKYISVVKTLGKGSRVEVLMKDMLSDVHLLVDNYSIRAMSYKQREEVAKAIEEAAALPPSLPEHTMEESGFTAFHSGSGAINQAQGDQYNNPGSGHIYHAENMTFGSNVDSKIAEVEDCLQALFQALRVDPRDDRYKLIDRKGARVEGTCKWITSNNLYNTWLHSHQQLLWLSGGPGKGKTMLSIFLIQELEELKQTTKGMQDAILLEFFCDNRNDTRHSADSIVRGLLFQLLIARSELSDHILPVYKVQKESLFTISSFESLWRIFEAMICDPRLGIMYCVIDGLDECDENSIEALLRRFRSLMSTCSNGSSSCQFHLVTVSRDWPVIIRETLSGFPRIRLDHDHDAEPDVNQDIHRFIDVKTDELASMKGYPDPLRCKVRDTLRDRADGTFLWVGIVADILRKFKPTEVEDALNDFPSGLNDLYARMLHQVDMNRREKVAEILRWVVMAVRPLTLLELSAVIEPMTGLHAPFSREDMIRDQLSYCGHFLRVREHEVSLIHQSAKEYLLHNPDGSDPGLEVFRIDEKHSNLQIARKCMDCLYETAPANKVHRWDLDDVSDLEAFPLLSYAAFNWAEHAKHLAPSADVFNSFFNDKETHIRMFWGEYYRIKGHLKVQPDFSKPLHIASWFGIVPLAERILLNSGIIDRAKYIFNPLINQRDSVGRTALAWAARCGHMTMARLLVDNGADVNVSDNVKRTALIEASAGGHKSMVQLLLDNGANTEAWGKLGRSAFHSAVNDGDDDLAVLLLERGVNINSSDKWGRTPLHLAAKAGDKTMVQLLIDNGADVGAKVLVTEESALHYATKTGSEVLMNMLLDNGADITATTRYGETLLHYASFEDNYSMVKFLLEKGVDVNAKDASQYTALDHAARTGHKKIIQMLLENGADVNARTWEGRTALYGAIDRGHEEVVQILLDKGADIESKNIEGTTPLHQAASKGDKKIVQILLENDADTEAKAQFGQTPLHNAAYLGRKEVVQMLLDNGADADVGEMNGWTPSDMASKKNHTDVVRLLETHTSKSKPIS